MLLDNLADGDSALHLLADGHAQWPQDDHLTEVYLRLLLQHNHLDVALPVVQAQPTTWHWLEWEGDLLAQQGDDMQATARYGLALARLDAARLIPKPLPIWFQFGPGYYWHERMLTAA